MKLYGHCGVHSEAYKLVESWERTFGMRPSVIHVRASTPAVPQVRAVEQQILKLLSQRQFTRALNMYRACERDGRDRHFVCETFYSNSFQSATRVRKVDVVE